MGSAAQRAIAHSGCRWRSPPDTRLRSSASTAPPAATSTDPKGESPASSASRASATQRRRCRRSVSSIMASSSCRCDRGLAPLGPRLHPSAGSAIRAAHSRCLEATMAYWVIGGEYTDTSFTHIVGGDAEERIGPFKDYDTAKSVWARLAWQHVDEDRKRTRILHEESNEFWVVGGCYQSP